MTDATGGCPLCHEVSSIPSQRGFDGVIVPDANPVSEGHLLVIPRRHVERLEALPPSEWVALFTVLHELVRDVALGDADGINVGVNSGAAAGQTVAHAHVHVIPRREGDCRDPRGGVRWVIGHDADYWNASGRN